MSPGHFLSQGGVVHVTVASWPKGGSACHGALLVTRGVVHVTGAFSHKGDSACHRGASCRNRGSACHNGFLARGG